MWTAPRADRSVFDVLPRLVCFPPRLQCLVCRRPIWPSWSVRISSMPPPSRGILATPDPIELPLNPSWAALIELIKIRGLRVPPHRTDANPTHLIAMYNWKLINSWLSSVASNQSVARNPSYKTILVARVPVHPVEPHACPLQPATTTSSSANMTR